LDLNSFFTTKTAQLNSMSCFDGVLTAGETGIQAPKTIFTFTFALDNLTTFPVTEPDGALGEE
jgi:hypothetical protein